MIYANEQHLRGVDPLVNTTYCAASNLANIVPPQYPFFEAFSLDPLHQQERETDQRRVRETAREIFTMGVDRLVDLREHLGVDQMPMRAVVLIEGTSDIDAARQLRVSPLAGATLPVDVIRSADIPTEQGVRLLKATEAAIVTDRIAPQWEAQAAILGLVHPTDDRQFGPVHDLHEAYLQRTMYHHPAQVARAVKSVIEGVVSVAQMAHFALSERGEETPDGPVSLRTFGY